MVSFAAINSTKQESVSELGSDSGPIKIGTLLLLLCFEALKNGKWLTFEKTPKAEDEKRQKEK